MKKLSISKPLLITYFVGGAAIILLVGILAGTVGRKCKPIEMELTTSAPGTTPQSTSQQVVTTQSTTSQQVVTTQSTTSQQVVTTQSTTSQQVVTTQSTTTQQVVTTPSTTGRTIPPVTNRTTPQVTSSPSPSDIRLPDIYKVNIYTLTMRAYFLPTHTSINAPEGSEYFNGNVKINFNLINDDTNTLVLHAHPELMIGNTITLKNLNTNAQVVIIKPNHSYLTNERYIVNLPNTILKGNTYELDIDFSGKYGYEVRRLAGFYISKYEEDGVTKTVASTQFQPTDARRAFPCFDEPALKAKFKIIIEHPPNTRALSNWPEGPTTDFTDNDGNARKRTEYSETYVMSTYLAAWAITPDDYGFVTSEGDSIVTGGNGFVKSASKDLSVKSGVTIRIFTRKSALEANLADFAAEAAKLAFDYFAGVYFNITEAVPPKIDMISIPAFSGGAMENWGLVTYRETALLYSENTNSLIDKQNVARIIAHELAHFWFGNLVTCKWWDELWLNEAMASFLQNKAVQAVYPEFELESQFLSNSLIQVMYDDGFYSSHPVYADVVSPAQISSIFDSITYDKGNALLRMLESTVGAANFQAGLNIYLDENEYDSGEAIYFYRDLVAPPEMGDVKIEDYMENWLNEMNYPLVHVSLDNSGAKSVVKFYQDRFVFTEHDPSFDNDPKPSEDFRWKIYLRCKSGYFNSTNPGSLEKTFGFYFEEGQGELILEGKFDWIKCNDDMRGFYVTRYDNPMYDILGNLVANTNIFNIDDRADILHSAFSMAYHETLSYSIAFELTDYLSRGEKAYVPWRIFSWHMEKIVALLEHRPSFLNVKNYVNQLVRDYMEANNIADIWDDTGDHTTRLLKVNNIDLECRMQSPEFLKNVSEKFYLIPANYFTSPDTVTNPIRPNLRSIVYRYHLQNTYDYSDWNSMFDLYRRTSDPLERSTAVRALSYTRHSFMIDYFLSLLLEENSQVRADDTFNVIGNLGRNPFGRHISWAFFRQEWPFFEAKFGPSRGSGGAIRAIAESFDNGLLFNELLEFHQSIAIGSDKTLRIQSLYIVSNNFFWILLQEKDFIDAIPVPLRSHL